MRLLLTGASGQLGTELLASFDHIGEIFTADITPPVNWTGPFQQLDIKNSAGLTTLLEKLKPQVIVNAAAYTAVDKAESEPALANAVNATAPATMARWARRNGAFLLHYSTDYVFDGRSNRPYRESDAPSPLNAYGESKLAGERAVAESGCAHVILRTSWLYSAHGQNFLKTMLRLAGERPHLSVVSDQHGRTTWARNLARVSAMVVERMYASPEEPDNASRPEFGIYHYCDSPATTWYDFANLIFEVAQARGLIDRKPRVEPVSSSQFQTAANRPGNSVLDTEKIQQAFRIETARMDESVAACIEDLIG